MRRVAAILAVTSIMVMVALYDLVIAVAPNVSMPPGVYTGIAGLVGGILNIAIALSPDYVEKP